MRFAPALAAFALLSGLPAAVASVASADTLTVTSSSPTVTAERFEYRRVSTRDWYTWIGCWSYDFLQGSGWFPTTWWYDEPFDAAGSVELSRKWRENYCAAAMDEINTTWFRYTDDDGRVLRGTFRIVPGADASDSVECRLTDVASSHRNFECTEAAVAVDQRDVTVRIDIVR